MLSALITAAGTVAASSAAAGLNYASQQDANEIGYLMNLQNNWFNAVQNINSMKNQWAMQQKQFEQNQQLLREEREYNLPSAQVQRYMAAGINPISAMSSGGVQSGNGSTLAAPSSSGPSMVPLQAFRPDAPVVNGVAEGINSAQKNVIDAAMARVAAKRAAAQNAVDFENVSKIKADTQAILDGNRRNEDLFTFQIYEAQQNLSNMKADNAVSRATEENIKVRSEAMLVKAQKDYSDMLSQAIQMEQNRFGQEIQTKHLEVEAKESQAKIAAMSLSQLIDYASNFGNRKELRNKYGNSWSKGNTASMHGDMDIELNYLSPVMGDNNFQFGGSYGAQESQSGDSSAEVSLAYTEVRQDTLEPIQASIRLLQEIQRNPSDVKLGRALTNLSRYLNSTAVIAWQNFLRIQGQIQALNISSLNPSGQDTYRSE